MLIEFEEHKHKLLKWKKKPWTNNCMKYGLEIELIKVVEILTNPVSLDFLLVLM